MTIEEQNLPEVTILLWPSRLRPSEDVYRASVIEERDGRYTCFVRVGLSYAGTMFITGTRDTLTEAVAVVSNAVQGLMSELSGGLAVLTKTIASLSTQPKA